MYHYEITQDIEVQVDSAPIVYLFQLWSKQYEAQKCLPWISEFGPKKLQWCAGNLAVIVPSDDGEFHYRSFGKAISQLTGFDMTGKKIGDFDSSAGAYFRDSYQRCVDTRAPLYTVNKALHVATVHTWERLLLPVRDNHGLLGDGIERIVLLVFIRPLLFRHEFLQQQLDACTVGLVSIGKLLSTNGEISGLHILNMNPTATQMLGCEAKITTQGEVREVLPGIFGEQLYDLCLLVLHGDGAAKRDLKVFCGQTTRHLQVHAREIDGSVTLTLTEMASHNDRSLMSKSPLPGSVPGSNDDAGLSNGVLSRHAFVQHVEAEIAKATRHSPPLCVLAMDLDRLNNVNDLHGFEVGDELVLKACDACVPALRHGDVFGRWEGGRFTACLPATDGATAYEVGERVRAAVSSEFVDQPMLSLQITISIGAAQWQFGQDCADLLNQSEQALLDAKDQGRDRVILLNDNGQ